MNRLAVFGLSVCAWLGVVLPTPTVSAQPLTLNDAMQRVDQLQALNDVTLATVSEVSAQAAQAGRWADPGLEIQLRSLFDDASELEVVLRQELPLNGAKGAEREALEATAESLGYSGQGHVQRYKAEVAAAFHEAIFRKERLVVLEERLTAVRNILDMLQKRESAGESSRYEVQRVELEVARLQRAYGREVVDQAAARQRVGVLLQSEVAEISGSLDVDACGGGAADTWETKALTAAIKSEQARLSQANRFWIPGVTLGLGYVGFENTVNDLGSGFIVGLDLTLPLWRSGSVAEDVFEARAAALNAQKSLVADRQTRTAQFLTAQCQKLQTNAAELDETMPKSLELAERTDAGYRAGELTLVELLDAQKAVLEDRLERLDVKLRIRRVQDAWIVNAGGWP